MFFNTWHMAWRNLWRQPRRTWITVAALALGMAMMVFSAAFTEGMMDRMVKDFTGAYSGHAQIHVKDYLQKQEPGMAIPNAQQLLANARKNQFVATAVPRAFSEGLAAIGDRSSGVKVIGTEFSEEKKLSAWHKRLLRGRLPTAKNEAVVGHKLATTLEIETGSPLVLTVPQVGSGDLSYQRVTIVGVLFTGHGELDQTAVIVPLASLQTWLNKPGIVHELALKLKNPDVEAADIKKSLANLTGKGLEVLPWQSLQPALAQMMALQDFWMVIALAIIYSLILLGIINALAMSMLERRREFGVLKAIGTPPTQLGLMVALEALSLGCLGTFLGVLLGLAITGLMGINGLTMSQVEMMGMTFRESIFPIINPWTVTWIAMAFVALTPITTVGLALKTALLDPIAALRTQ